MTKCKTSHLLAAYCEHFHSGKYLLKFNIKDNRTTSLMRSVGKNIFKISNIDTGAIFKIGSTSIRFTPMLHFNSP